MSIPKEIPEELIIALQNCTNNNKIKLRPDTKTFVYFFDVPNKTLLNWIEELRSPIDLNFPAISFPDQSRNCKKSAIVLKKDEKYRLWMVCQAYDTKVQNYRRIEYELVVPKGMVSFREELALSTHKIRTDQISSAHLLAAARLITNLIPHIYRYT